MYEEINALCLDPDSNKMVPIQSITCAEDVPLIAGVIDKFFKVQWEKMMTNQRGQTDTNGKPWKLWGICGTLLLRSEVCDHYLCSKVVSVLGSEGVRLSVKPMQVLKTMIVACIICVSNLADLVALSGILKKLCAETELLMMRHGRNKQYEGTDFPDFQISRRPAKEPDVPEKYNLKGLSDEFRSLKMVLVIECECDDGKMMWSVLHLIEKTGSLKKYFGQCAKVPGMGPYGPRLDDIDGQCKRAGQLKVNMSFNCCTTGALLKGLTHPNKKWYAKMKDGTYWPVGGKTTSWNSEFQNMRIRTDSDGHGTGKSPFICAVPNAAGSKAGSSTLIYWDDSKDAPPPKRGVKRTVDGPISDLVRKLKGAKAA